MSSQGPELCAENFACAGPRTRRPLATQALSTKLISKHVDSSWWVWWRERLPSPDLPGSAGLVARTQKMLSSQGAPARSKHKAFWNLLCRASPHEPTIGASVSIYHKVEHMWEASPWLAVSRSTYVQLQKAPSSKGCSGMASGSTWFSRDLPLP